MSGYLLHNLICICYLIAYCNGVFYGGSCSSSSSCFGTNTICDSSTNTCTCKADHVVMKLPIDCVPKAQLGGICPWPYSGYLCIDINAECTFFPRYCVCRSEYYDSTGVVVGGTCIIKKSLGETCPDTSIVPASDSCADTNASCIWTNTGYKCICRDGYYDDGLFGSVGACRLITKLKVGSVLFRSILNTSITVSWSHPPGDLVQHVDFYTIHWALKGTSLYEQSGNLSSSTTQYVLNGTTSGKAYDVSIVSHIAQTVSEMERTTNVTKQIAANFLYPYGQGLDMYLGRSDDECSQAITFEQGIPLFNEKFTDIYVCPNGLVSFGQPFTNPVPHKDLNLYENRTILAPFYTDINIGDQGSVSYRAYSIENDPDDLSRQDVQNVSHLLKENGASEHFVVRYILFATWHRVNPSQQTFDKTKESTFQLVLASSGIETYAMYIYPHGHMKWSATITEPRIWVGYVVSGKEVFSHVNSFTNMIMEIDQHAETGDIKGMLLLSLNNGLPTTATQSMECLNWYYETKRTHMDVQNPVLMECPCDLQTLGRDPRFSRPQMEKAGVKCSIAWPSLLTLPHGMKCCYGEDDELFIQDMPDAGGFLIHHPLDRKLHVQNDIIPKQKCCIDPAYCHLYYDIHPIGTCYSKTWFKFGTFWGDPHFRTLDGLNFTFNGRGEFTMMKVDGFELQARTEPVDETSNATIFSAFAAKQNNKDLFHVELNTNKTGLILYGAGVDLTNEFEDADDETRPFIFTSTDKNVVLTKDNDTLRAYFVKTEIALNVSIGIKMLTLNVLVPNKFQNKTTGLLGNFDGIAENDFITLDGETLSSEMSEQEIFNYGYLWEIDGKTSAFIYDDLKDHTDYQHNNHIPPFLSDIDSETKAGAEAVCTLDDSACMIDFFNAGEAVANNTQLTNEQSQHDLTEIGKTTPKLTGCDQLFVTPGMTSVCQVSLENVENDRMLFEFIGTGNGKNNDAEFNPDTLTITYTHPTDEIEPVQIRLVGENSEGKRSPPLQVKVVLCTGCSGHGVCLNVTRKDRKETAFTKYAKCECELGYDGDNCEHDADGCASEPCGLGRDCVDLQPDEERLSNVSHVCSDCPPGWVLEENKCIDINECDTDNGGCEQICSNTEGGYTCSCDVGYIMNPYLQLNDGVNMCVDINECDLEEHNCTEICINTEGGFICTCHEGYTFYHGIWSCIKDSSYQCSLDCSLADGCKVENGNETCFCKRGFEIDTGGLSCIDINECERNVCHQLCENTVGGFNCSCQPGYRLISETQCKACQNPFFGDNCERRCECTGQGAVTCDSVKGCICSEGWTGDTCSEDINECDTYNVCGDVRKVCKNILGSYSCECSPGYELNEDGNCQDIDECSSPALNDCSQICSNTFGNYSCGCNRGYIPVNATHCEDIDECSLHIDECDQICVNVPGRYNCFCKFGYQLLQDRKTCQQVDDPCKTFYNLTCEHYCFTTVDNAVCKCRSGYILEEDGQQCKDINECEDNSYIGQRCSGSAICVNTDGSFLCNCPIGTKLENDDRTCSECDQHHYGKNCSKECSCLNGFCDNIRGCICDQGWAGEYCDGEVDACFSLTGNTLCTEPNTVCESRVGKAVCVCKAGFHNLTGVCQDIDECTTTPSVCDQVCHNTVGSYTCDCHTGFQMVDGKCVDIDECKATDRCDTSLCTNTAGGYLCSCLPGSQLDLTNRRTCNSIECNDSDLADECRRMNAKCVRNPPEEYCLCEKGYQMINNTCRDIDECLTSPCDYKCQNYNGGFKCVCEQGFGLLPDGTSCKECPNGFYGNNCNMSCDCDVDNTEFCDTVDGTCHCKTGWEGDTCTADIDECSVPGDVCPTESYCGNIDGSFICHCNVGFVKVADGKCQACANGRYGPNCQEECQCFDDNTISCNHVNGTCECIEGWTGNCSVDIDECQIDSCSIKLFSECNNFDGGYSCTCPAGYLDVGQCKDVDECSNSENNDCEFICYNTNGSYECLCKEGFSGWWNNCSECSGNTYGQNCSYSCDCVIDNLRVQYQQQGCDTVTGQCMCKEGWHGWSCANDTNECEDSSICENIPNTECHNTKGSHACACLKGFKPDAQGRCLRNNQDPMEPLDTDEFGIMSVSIRLEVDLPPGFNLNTNIGFDTVTEKVLASLYVFYSRYTEPDKINITVTDIRFGSIIVDYEIIYSISDDKVIENIVQSNIDIAAGNVVLEYDNNTVYVSSDMFGTTATPCDVYTKLIGKCANGFQCIVENDTPKCSEMPGDDITIMYIGIGIGVGSLFVMLLFIGCVAKIVCRTRRKNKNKHRERRNIRQHTLGYSNPEICTRDVEQFPSTHGSRNDDKKLTWKSMLSGLSNEENGERRPVVKIPRAHLGDIYVPKILK